MKHAITYLLRAADIVSLRFRWKLARMALGHIGPGVRLSGTVKIYAGRGVSIGDRTVLNDFVHIWGAGGVTLGKDCLVAAHVVITSQSHDISAATHGLLYSQTSDNKPVIIGDNVWLGSNVTILPGVTIGDGAVIGAGSVVTRDVDSYHLAVGTPARMVRSLL
jgi:maltose O-acetyltransferase